MGSLFVNAVINGLKGQDISYPPSGSNDRKCARTFGASDLALLAVIANRQPNPGYNGNDDTICYGDVKTLYELAHIKKSSFFSVRNFLVNVRLINFFESEGANTNVYRINVGKIRELCKAQKSQWSRDILGLKSEDISKLNSRQRRILCVEDAPISEVQDLENPVQTMEPGVQKVESGVQNLDTNINRNKNKNTNINIHTPKVDDGGVDKVWDYERTEHACAWLNANCSLQLDVAGLMSAFQDHSHQEGCAAVHAALNDLETSTTRIKNREGFFINRLKMHLASGVKADSVDKKAQFTPPERIITREEFAESWWKRIDNEFGFKQDLSEAEYAELKRQSIHKIIEYRSSDLQQLMEVILDYTHYYFEHGKNGVKTPREALVMSMNEHV